MMEDDYDQQQQQYRDQFFALKIHLLQKILEPFTVVERVRFEEEIPTGTDILEKFLFQSCRSLIWNEDTRNQLRAYYRILLFDDDDEDEEEEDEAEIRETLKQRLDSAFIHFLRMMASTLERLYIQELLNLPEIVDYPNLAWLKLLTSLRQLAISVRWIGPQFEYSHDAMRNDQFLLLLVKPEQYLSNVNVRIEKLGIQLIEFPLRRVYEDSEIMGQFTKYFATNVQMLLYEQPTRPRNTVIKYTRLREYTLSLVDVPHNTEFSVEPMDRLNHWINVCNGEMVSPKQIRVLHIERIGVMYSTTFIITLIREVIKFTHLTRLELTLSFIFQSDNNFQQISKSFTSEVVDMLNVEFQQQMLFNYRSLKLVFPDEERHAALHRTDLDSDLYQHFSGTYLLHKLFTGANATNLCTLNLEVYHHMVGLNILAPNITNVYLDFVHFNNFPQSYSTPIFAQFASKNLVQRLYMKNFSKRNETLQSGRARRLRRYYGNFFKNFSTQFSQIIHLQLCCNTNKESMYDDISMRIAPKMDRFYLYYHQVLWENLIAPLCGDGGSGGHLTELLLMDDHAKSYQFVSTLISTWIRNAQRCKEKYFLLYLQKCDVYCLPEENVPYRMADQTYAQLLDDANEVKNLRLTVPKNITLSTIR